MARALFQVLVIPYRFGADGLPQYAIFKRSDMNVWQGIAGGGEDNEMPEQAARREAREEAGIPEDALLIRLDSLASIPSTCFPDHHLWAADIDMIPEYSFGIEVKEDEICLSDEHSEYAWLDYEAARDHFKWDSNKTALWELHRRISIADRA